VNTSGRVIGVGPGAGTVVATSGATSSQPFAITVTSSGSVAAVVTMQPNTFTPFTSTIKAGQTVAFDFPSLAHNVKFDQKTGSPADIPETVNKTVTRLFTAAGTFPFRCDIHPGMNGQVVVNP
jgi:plastocyanin